MTVKKNKTSAQGKEFWEVAAQAAEKVKSWPAWKRGESILAPNPADNSLGNQPAATPGESINVPSRFR